MPSQLDRLFYVDDSGRPSAGRVVYGWISFEPWQWRDVLGAWLDLRASLWRQFRVPVTQELHTTEYVNGCGRISTNPPDAFLRNGQTLWRDLGKQVAIACLQTLSSVQGLRIGAIIATQGPGNLAHTKRDLYAALLTSFEEALAERDALGLVFVDGDGRDTMYRDVHRSLPRRTRRIVEDPIHQDSKTSQLMQMADLVAWTANAHADPPPKLPEAQKWWAQHLEVRDPARQPQLVAL